MITNLLPRFYGTQCSYLLSCMALPLLIGRYSFSVPLMVGGCDGLIGSYISIQFDRERSSVPLLNRVDVQKSVDVTNDVTGSLLVCRLCDSCKNVFFLFSYYPHMPISMLGIYRLLFLSFFFFLSLLFVCLFVRNIETITAKSTAKEYM